MAVTIRARFPNASQVRRDLKMIERGIGREVTAAFRTAGMVVAARTAALTPRGPGPRAGAKNPNDRLPHVADTIRAGTKGKAITVRSTHPAAPVLEFGGTIRPRGAPIHFRARAMAKTAGERTTADLERELERQLDALLRRHGL